MNTASLEDLLRSLQEQNAQEVLTREEFTNIMQACDILNISDREMSDDLGVSFNTVTRWREGRTQPHASLHTVVAEYFIGKVNDRLAA